MKDHQIRLQDQEIAALREEVEALRSGKDPAEVPRVSSVQGSIRRANDASKSEPIPRESPNFIVGSSPNSMKYHSSENPNI